VLERALEQLGADVVSHAFKRGVLIKAYIPLGEAQALFVATHSHLQCERHPRQHV